MNEVTVVIVDDQPIIRNGLAAIFHAEPGFAVLATAADGREAVAAVEAHRPRLILMDIQMPVMDGLEATRRIMRQYPGTCIILLTTFEDEEYIWKALQSGARGYVLKDMETEQMLETVHSCLHGQMSFPATIQQKLMQTAMHNELPNQGGDIPWQVLGVHFTEREQEMIRMLSEGNTNREIADRLHLSEGTVKNYMMTIYQKMKVKRRTEALAWITKRTT